MTPNLHEQEDNIFVPPLFPPPPSALQTLCYDEETVLQVIDTGALGEI